MVTLTRFREQAVHAKRLDASLLPEDNSSLIEKLRLMENGYLKRAAVLLFHPDPERYFTGSSIKIGYFEGRSNLRYHDEVCGNLFTQLDKSMDLLLTKYLKAIFSYKRLQRFETYPVPESALREAMLNAVIHRDYAVAAPIQIRVYDDRLYIWNPGEPPKDWSLAKLLGQHSSRPYNPDIANAFFRSGEVESWGRGIEHIFETCQEENTPEPVFKIESGEFQVEFLFSEAYLDSVSIGDRPRETFGRTTQEIEETTQEIEETIQEIEETIQETTQEKILVLLRENPNFTQKALAENIGISPDGIKYHLDNLRKSGRIRHVGPTKKGRWEVMVDNTE